MLERLGLLPKRSFGLRGLDLKLAQYITFRDGMFVEAGANDGLSQSNSAYFETYLGWRGLLVEPVPELAAQCRANRPLAKVEQCALVGREFSEPFVEMNYCNLMSFVHGARGSVDADQAHIDSALQYLKPEEATYTLQVPAKTLDSVLSSHGIKKVDLLSLDVEGYEGQVLDGLDFDVCAPRYILVEANNLPDIERALQGRYELVAQLSFHDRLYKFVGD